MIRMGGPRLLATTRDGETAEIAKPIERADTVMRRTNPIKTKKFSGEVLRP